MEEIAISKFKAICLAVLQRVCTTGQPIRVTRFGKAIAEINPPRVAKTRRDWLGCMKGRVTILGDIVAPISRERDWDAGRGEWEPPKTS